MSTTAEAFTRRMAAAAAKADRREVETATIRGLTFSVEDITPGLAQRYIAGLAPNNRKSVTRKITQFAADMEAEDWLLNGEPIIFDTKGRVIDGEHRLRAITLSGASATMVVIRGVDPEARRTVDTGTARSFGQVCEMDGIKNPNAVAAVTRRAYLIDTKGSYMSRGPGSGERVPSHSALKEYRDAHHPEISLAVVRGQDVRKAFGVVTTNIAATAFLLFSRIDPDQAHLFIEQLAFGEGLKRGMPAYTLRERLTKDATRTVDQKRLSSDEHLGLICRSWNHYRDDEPVERLMLTRQGDLTNDNFPVPR